MTCQSILEQLRIEFEGWSCSTHPSCSEFELEKLPKAMTARGAFLLRYPYASDPVQIGALTAKSLYDPGPGQDYFLRWIIWGLRPLGGIGIKDMNPFRDALNYVPEIRQALSITLDSENEIAVRIDSSWSSIPGLGSGDRVVVKKIVATYFPNEIVPVFNQNHMEHFVAYLGRNGDRDSLSRTRHSKGYQTSRVARNSRCSTRSFSIPRSTSRFWTKKTMSTSCIACTQAAPDRQV